MNTFSCGEDQFKDSYSYIFYKYKDKIDNLSNIEVGTAKYDFQMATLEPLINDLKYGKGGNTGVNEFQCPLYQDKCRFLSTNLKDIIEHENECLGLDRPLPNDNEYELSYKKYNCPNVGCKFFSYDHGTVKGQYALNRHKTTCMKSLAKKLRKRVKDGLGNLGLNELQEIIKFCEKNNITLS